jgi:hypothetical protein
MIKAPEPRSVSFLLRAIRRRGLLLRGAVMRKNATVSIYVPIVGKNSEGSTAKAWGYKQSPVVAPIETFRADVQPYRLKEAELELWGLSNRISDTKRMFAPNSPNIFMGNRAAVISDFDGVTRYYDIMGSNQWGHHAEPVLVPVQGE